MRGVPPAIDLAAERALQLLLVALADARLIRSAHDCSDGGLAVTVAECCFDTGAVGVEVSIGGVEVSRRAAVNCAAALFGESSSRVVISAAPESVRVVLARAASAGVPAAVVGRVGGTAIRIAVGGTDAIDVPVDECERAWSTAIERYFAQKVA